MFKIIRRNGGCATTTLYAVPEAVEPDLKSVQDFCLRLFVVMVAAPPLLYNRYRKQ
ncbi:MAG: hypothetical protein V2I33_21440 [Kangiellaceae bacterium]|nr:hypothetical protein [Kangiellaceae bacterium]